MWDISLGLELGTEGGLGKIPKGTMLSGKTKGLEMSLIWGASLVAHG